MVTNLDIRVNSAILERLVWDQTFCCRNTTTKPRNSNRKPGSFAQAQNEGSTHMAKEGPRIIIKLESTAGTGYYYTTTKNRRNTQEKLELKKYDPVARKHVIFKEKKV